MPLESPHGYPLNNWAWWLALCNWTIVFLSRGREGGKAEDEGQEGEKEVEKEEEAIGVQGRARVYSVEGRNEHHPPQALVGSLLLKKQKSCSQCALSFLALSFVTEYVHLLCQGTQQELSAGSLSNSRL